MWLESVDSRDLHHAERKITCANEMLPKCGIVPKLLFPLLEQPSRNRLRPWSHAFPASNGFDILQRLVDCRLCSLIERNPSGRASAQSISFRQESKKRFPL